MKSKLVELMSDLSADKIFELVKKESANAEVMKVDTFEHFTGRKFDIREDQAIGDLTRLELSLYELCAYYLGRSNYCQTAYTHDGRSLGYSGQVTYEKEIAYCEKASAAVWGLLMVLIRDRFHVWDEEISVHNGVAIRLSRKNK